MQPLWRMVWRLLKKLKIELLYDPESTLLGIFPEKSIMVIASLFTIARTLMQPKCSSVNEWIKKTWYTYTMEYSIQFSHYSDCLFATPWTACSMPRFPVHQLPELAQTQTHVHWVGDDMQPSHPLLSPSLLAFNPSQHQSLLQWVSSSHHVVKILEFHLQHQCLQGIFRTYFF